MNPMKMLFDILISVLNTEIYFRMVKGTSLSLINSGLEDHPQKNNSPQYEKVVLKRICAAYKKAKRVQSKMSGPYLPGNKWEPQIAEKRREYIESLELNDLKWLGKLLENFFRNSGVISIIKYNQYSQLIRQSSFLADYAKKRVVFNTLLDIKTWKTVFGDLPISELAIPNIGNPYGCLVDNVLINPSACCLYYYASKIENLLHDNQSSVVAEIGGGFGGFAYYLLKKKDCTYINFDIPEIILVAQYFLMMAFPQKRFLLYGEGNSDLSISTISKYDVILMPNFELQRLAANSVDVFVNTHSLSEMEMPTVSEYLRQISRVTKYYFFHENSEVERKIGYGYVELPANTFPIDPNTFQLKYRKKAIWREKCYWEYLYQKV